MWQLLFACMLSSIHAYPGLLADLKVASTAASEACGSSLEVGVVAAGATEGASVGVAASACAVEYSAGAAGAVLTFATSVIIMWATSNTTPPPCGASFDLGSGQSCFNFPEHSLCYQQCCQVQTDWCGSSDLDNQQCLKDRACIYPNIREFSSEQLTFLHNDMDDLNDQYNDMVEQLCAINITQTVENQQWGDLLLACNNMLSSGRDFIDRIGLAQQHVSCDNPETLCSLASAEGAFQLQSSWNHQHTCFNFLGPCYSTCCKSQAGYCGCLPGHTGCNTQCMHDRGCRATPDSDTLQAVVCQHLDSCRTSMRMAVDGITNLHDCTLQMAGGGCSGSAVRHQFEMVTSKLNDTHTELEALESLIVGHGTHSLETLELISSVNSVSSLDLGQYWETARSEPFKIVFEHPGEATVAPSPTRDTSSLIPAFCAILGSSLWIAVILRTPKTSSAGTAPQSEALQPLLPKSLEPPWWSFWLQRIMNWISPAVAQDTPEVVAKRFLDDFEKQINQMAGKAAMYQTHWRVSDDGSVEGAVSMATVEEHQRQLDQFKSTIAAVEKSVTVEQGADLMSTVEQYQRLLDQFKSTIAAVEKHQRQLDQFASDTVNHVAKFKSTIADFKSQLPQPTDVEKADVQLPPRRQWLFLWPSLGPIIAMIVLYCITPAPGPSTMQSMISAEVDSDTLSHVYWDHVSSSMHPIITHLSSLEQSTCSRMLTSPISENVGVLFQYLTEVPH